MAKEQTNYRLDSEAKAEAYVVLQQMGLSPSDAVNMFMHHLAMFKELPFHPRIPNETTLQTFKDSEAGINCTKGESLDDLFDDLGL